MIKSIRLTNFFSFKDEKIDFHPEVNLMVGVNGSGKSNLIKAIRLLKTAADGNGTNLPELIVGKWGGFENVIWKGREANVDTDSFHLEFVFDREALNKFGSFAFEEDVVFELAFIRKRGLDNYYISESIGMVSGFSFLEGINGAGQITEWEQNGTHKPAVASFDPVFSGLSLITDLDKERYMPLIQLKRAIFEIAIYNDFDTSENSAIRRAISATSSHRRLLGSGDNLAQMLNTINIKYKSAFKAILGKLKDVNEHFSGIDFHFLGSGTLEMLLDEDGLGSPVHITHVSDGTLRFLYLLTILLNPERGRFICIDEPEVGLHPDMIYGIASAVQEVMGETTFLIATHSENVLNSFSVENVRVFEKDEMNSTLVRQFREDDFAGWYDEFSPGAMWRAGDMGGKRW